MGSHIYIKYTSTQNKKEKEKNKNKNNLMVFLCFKNTYLFVSVHQKFVQFWKSIFNTV